MRSFFSLAPAALPLALLTASALVHPARSAEPRSGNEGSQYSRDVISVATIGRHSQFPTANCIVWANAEGLGVGPEQLDGYHGVSMNINLKPLSIESNQHATLFTDGIEELKSKFPKTPEWMVQTIEKNRVAIESACLGDHVEPFEVYKITARDRH